MTLVEALHKPAVIETIKCVLINLVPVIFYAIWGSTFLEELEDENREEPPRSERDRETERAGQLRQIQLVYACTVVGQVLAYGVSHEAARAPFHLNIIIFFFGILVQGQLKFGLEKKVRGLAATAPEHTVRMGRAFLVMFGLFFTYMSLVHGCGVLGAAAARALHLGPNAEAAARLAGSFVGVFGALLAAFAGSPWYLRRFLPVRKLSDSRQIHALDSHFIAAGLTPPEFWALELEHFGSHNAVMTGLKQGRGLFRPSLFLSRSLLRDFTPGELRAIILHEISHVKLRHLRNRFWTTLAALAGACVLSAGVIGIACLALPPQLVVMFAAPIAFLPAFAPYLAVRRQMRRQELEADAHAVFELGASLDDLMSALKRLDRMNDRAPGQTPASFSDGTHPSTDERIRQLKEEQARRNASSGIKEAA